MASQQPMYVCRCESDIAYYNASDDSKYIGWPLHKPLECPFWYEDCEDDEVGWMLVKLVDVNGHRSDKGWIPAWFRGRSRGPMYQPCTVVSKPNSAASSSSPLSTLTCCKDLAFSGDLSQMQNFIGQGGFPRAPHAKDGQAFSRLRP